METRYIHLVTAVLIFMSSSVLLSIQYDDKWHELPDPHLIFVNPDLVGGYPADEPEPRNQGKKREPAMQEYTFKNLAGSVPKSVTEVVDFMKESPKYKEMGARMPSGILLVGPPGTGKTSIARAIAGEAQANFFSASASEFIEEYVGVGPKRVRELFKEAREAAASGRFRKSIVFIDEIDAIGGKRYSKQNEEYRNTLNELLNQMSGFERDGSLFVVAATNREQDIDSALKRPGRFDRIVKIDLPDRESRKAILKYYVSQIKAKSTINIDELSALTEGMSGADLENLVNEAAIRAVRASASVTDIEHFKEALAERRAYI